MSLPLSDQDLRGYSAIRFNVKGDGGTYRLQLGRTAVKDYAYPQADFTAGKDWAPVTIQLSSFAQTRARESKPRART